MHETALHEDNSFLTLTYDKLPKNKSLNKQHLSAFIKRLRARIAPIKIKFFGAGEYGDPEKGERVYNPHYHVAIFGYAFPDKRVWKTQKDYNLYISSELDAAWGHGYATIGELTHDSACYIAGYTTKKITGKGAKKHYGKRISEFAIMSRGGRQRGTGGISCDW